MARPKRTEEEAKRADEDSPSEEEKEEEEKEEEAVMGAKPSYVYPELDDFGRFLIDIMKLDVYAAKELIRQGLEGPDAIAMFDVKDMESIMSSASKTPHPMYRDVRIPINTLWRQRLNVFHVFCGRMKSMHLEIDLAAYTTEVQSHWVLIYQQVQKSLEQRPKDGDVLSLIPPLKILGDYEVWWDPFSDTIGGLKSVDNFTPLSYILRANRAPDQQVNIDLLSDDFMSILEDRTVMSGPTFKADNERLYKFLSKATEKTADCRSIVMRFSKHRDGRGCLEAIWAAANGPDAKNQRIKQIESKRDKAKFYGTTPNFPITQYTDVHRDCNRRLNDLDAEPPGFKKVQYYLGGIECPPLTEQKLALSTDTSMNEDFEKVASRMLAVTQALADEGKIYTGRSSSKRTISQMEQDGGKQLPGGGKPPADKKFKKKGPHYGPGVPNLEIKAGIKYDSKVFRKMSKAQRDQLAKVRAAAPKPPARTVNSVSSTSPTKDGKDKEDPAKEQRKVANAGTEFGRGAYPKPKAKKPESDE